MPKSNRLPDWAHVEQPVSHGLIKASPQDFLVDERLGFELSGTGEYLYLLIEKCGMNTLDLLKQLSKQLNIHPKHISYAGLKDKQAVTRQWLSIFAPGDIDINDFKSTELAHPGFRVLEARYHVSKLKSGAHRANQFEIVIREISEFESFETAIQRVARQGVPNYFGEQRFGREGKNLDKARALFGGKRKVERKLRGLYLSAARSFLFNQVLSARVEQSSWAAGLPGEVLMLDGSNSFFKTETLDATLRERLGNFDIHPSAPLWGKGRLASSGAVFTLETELMAQYPDLTSGLEAFGLRQQRRATRLIPKGLVYSRLDETSIKLSFELGKGCFATTVLRELVSLDPQ